MLFFKETAPTPANKIFAFLTIDDAPSEHLLKRAEYLEAKEIDCIFFCRGDMIARYESLLIDVIQKGFIIGNHSFSHQAYSDMDEESFFNEILHTQALIDQCYEKAAVPKPHRYIRLPFGDRGAGKDLKKPVSSEEILKTEHLQTFLAANGFCAPAFMPELGDQIDLGWTLSPLDYKKE